MNEDLQPKLTQRTFLSRRVAIYAGVLLIVFMLGFFPMWIRGRSCSSSLADTERRLTLAQIQNSLSAAAIDARRGDYEPARQAASQFFTFLRAESDKGDNSALTEAQRSGVQTLFTGRDEIITLLARSDPAAADRLSDLYASYRKIVNG